MGAKANWTFAAAADDDDDIDPNLTALNAKGISALVANLGTETFPKGTLLLVPGGMLSLIALLATPWTDIPLPTSVPKVGSKPMLLPMPLLP